MGKAALIYSWFNMWNSACSISTISSTISCDNAKEYSSLALVGNSGGNYSGD